MLFFVAPSAFRPAMSLPERVNFPQQEEEVLALWKRLDAFKTSLELSRGKPEYTVRGGAAGT